MSDEPIPHLSKRITQGRVQVWPTHWMGGSNSYKIDGHNTIWVDSLNAGGEICRMVPKGAHGHVTNETYANAALIVEAFNVADETGQTPAQLLEIARTLLKVVKAQHEGAHNPWGGTRTSLTDIEEKLAPKKQDDRA